MTEPPYLIGVIISVLGLLAWYLIRDWKKNWEDRVIGLDDRINKHDLQHGEHNVNHAILKANIEHIRTVADATSKDVKELLRQSNGKRSAG